MIAGIVKDDGDEPLFHEGDKVAISERFPVGHYRVPHYIRGKSALVEEVITPPAIDNEAEGFGRNVGLKRHYYRVSIPLTELWPGYTGSPHDGLRIEVYEMAGKDLTMHPHDHTPIVATDEAPGYYEIMETAVRELLVAKQIISAGEIRRHLEVLDSRTPQLGAKLVAKAWVDPDFKKRLLADDRAACEEMGISFYENTELTVLENTEKVHNLIVCTLCSCYPREVLGLPPDWYKLTPYRSRAVKEPRAVLAEFGTVIPDNVEIRVSDSTAMIRYLVLPRRPEGTDNMTEQQLAELVTRDAMIGVVPVEFQKGRVQ